MVKTSLLADLGRALDLLNEVNERNLDFSPDGETSADIHKLTGIENYPIGSHRENVQARIDAVKKAGDKLKPRASSDYISKLIPACVKLAPPSDDWRTAK